MIHVDRSRVPLPPQLAARLHRDQNKVNEQFRQMSAGSKSSQQRGFTFPPFTHVRPVLEELFVRKCAYCETALTASPGDVDNFRPKSQYWWLAFEWENLYLACGNCNRLYKSNKFPTAGTLAAPFTYKEALRGEHPLLIDPCGDDPSQYLAYDDDGKTIVARKLAGSARGEGASAMRRRAETTIELLGLNRPDLVRARAHVRASLVSMMEHLAPDAVRAGRVLPGILGPEQPYRAAASQWAAEIARSRNDPSWRRLSSLEEYLVEHGAVRDVVRRAIQRRRMRSSGVSSKGLQPRAAGAKRAGTATPPQEPSLVQPAFISRISIRNFKGIKRLELDLPLRGLDPAIGVSVSPDSAPSDSEPGTRTGWYVLLGENSVGKSSVLEAVALAIMGRDGLQTLIDDGRVSLAKLVHQPATSPGTRRNAVCTIRLRLQPSEIGDIELRITPSAFRFVKGGQPVPTLIRGYGYVRLLPRPTDAEQDRVSLARCDNLFDPRSPLYDAERWMASLPYDDTERSPFDYAAGAILKLLPRGALAAVVSAGESEYGGAYLKPKDGRVVMVLKQRELSLDQLSAGYQSVIALAADIMAGIPPDRLLDMREAAGIVLLDEIGTQLHPRWRMHAISDLRRAFPGMQFIATTHEPLCLKGVGSTEVAVLRRNPTADEVLAVTTGFQDPRVLRVDQLLTSPLFGLDSTIDPDVDERFQAYFALLARGDAATPAELNERRRLETELAPHRGLGYTRSDQLVYALLDEYLASEGARTAHAAADVPKAVRQQVFDIWRNVRAYRGSGA